MAKIKYQIIMFNVPQAGAVVNINANSDKLYKRITGLFASLPEDKAFAGTTLQFQINDQEVFPEGFEVKFISCSEHVSPNERFYNTNEEGDGSTLKGKYTDGGGATSYPYKGVLCLRLEDKNSQ